MGYVFEAMRKAQQASGDANPPHPPAADRQSPDSAAVPSTDADRSILASPFTTRNNQTIQPVHGSTAPRLNTTATVGFSDSKIDRRLIQTPLRDFDELEDVDLLESLDAEPRSEAKREPIRSAATNDEEAEGQPLLFSIDSSHPDDATTEAEENPSDETPPFEPTLAAPGVEIQAQIGGADHSIEPAENESAPQPKRGIDEARQVFAEELLSRTAAQSSKDAHETNNTDASESGETGDELEMAAVTDEESGNEEDQAELESENRPTMSLTANEDAESDQETDSSEDVEIDLSTRDVEASDDQDFDEACAPIPFKARATSDNVDDRLVSVTEPSSIMTEEYRGIRTRVLARYQNARHLIHTITSATPKEGKTLTSLNLGFCFAELADRQTVVVEGDLRMPIFQKMLNLPDRPGLIQVLRGQAKLDNVLLRLPNSRLTVLPAGGKTADDAIQLLSGTRMKVVLEALRGRFDHVVIDTPPALELADAGVLGSMSDDVMLIARMNRTPRYMIDQTLRVLKSYNAPVSGVVLTDMKLDIPSYIYRYSYKTGYGYYSSSSRRRKSA